MLILKKKGADEYFSADEEPSAGKIWELLITKEREQSGVYNASPAKYEHAKESEIKANAA